MNETRAATRLLAACVAAALGVYLLLGSLVGPESTLVRYGRSEQVSFALSKALTYEREPGQRVLWLVGSSILREGIDVAALQAQLDRDGIDWRVELLAIDRGGPIFAWGLTRQLPIEVGDRVVTLAAYHHLRRDWLAYWHGQSHYVQLLLDPDQIWSIDELHPADKAEYSLAALPPRNFHRFRDAVRDGITEWAFWLTGWSSSRPRIQAHASPWPAFTNLTNDVWTNRRIIRRNSMTLEDLQLEPGQINRDALLAWSDEVHERGAEPWVLEIPPSPRVFQKKMADDALLAAFRGWAGDHLPAFTTLPERPTWEYRDYNHPNRLGRRQLTRALHALLEQAER